MIKEQKMNILEVFLIFIAIMFKYLINISLPKRYLYLLLILILVIIIILFLNKRMTRNQLLRAFAFALIALYFTVFYEDVNFLISLILAVLCINKKEDDFIKTFFNSSLILYLLTIFLNIINVIPSHNMYRVVEEEYKIRYSLGFKHPNEVFLYFLPIAFTGYYLYSSKISFKLLILISSLVLYIFSYCRTGFAVIILLILLDFLFRKKGELKFINKIVPILFILLTLFSLIIALKFGQDKSNTISTVLSGRPYYWNYYIKKNLLLSIFGHNRIEGFYLDNFYIYLLVQLGLVGFIIYFYTYYKSLKIMKFNKKYSIIIIVFLIFGLFEANVIIGSIQFLYALQLKEIIVNGGKNEKSFQGKIACN